MSVFLLFCSHIYPMLPLAGEPGSTAAQMKAADTGGGASTGNSNGRQPPQAQEPEPEPELEPQLELPEPSLSSSSSFKTLWDQTGAVSRDVARQSNACASFGDYLRGRWQLEEEYSRRLAGLSRELADPAGGPVASPVRGREGERVPAALLLNTARTTPQTTPAPAAAGGCLAP
jgi:hypothetical protein